MNDLSTILVPTFVYGGVALALIAFLGPLMRASGQTYLEDVFDEDTATNINNMLLAAGALVTMAMALFMVALPAPDGSAASIRVLISRVALLLLIAGVAHLLNLAAFGAVRRYKRTQERKKA
ncbi:MAG: hypothetical protein R2754_04755 [Microthrixaceae bacterium]